MLVGHADAAVHLHAFLHRERRDSRPPWPWRPRPPVRRGRISVERLQRLEHRGPRDFDFGEQVRGAVLQRLELADQLAELLALLEVVERACEASSRQSGQLGGDRGAARR